MRVKTVIASYKAMGASEVELDPNTGKVVRVKFFEPKSKAPPKPEPSTAEKMAKDREDRNPRVDAVELAEKLIMDRNHGLS